MMIQRPVSRGHPSTRPPMVALLLMSFFGLSGLEAPSSPSVPLSPPAPAFPALSRLETDTPSQACPPDPQPLPSGSLLPVTTVTWQGRPLEVVAGELLLRFQPGLDHTTQRALLAKAGTKLLQEDPATGYARVSVPSHLPMSTLLARLSRLPEVVTVRPNAVFHGAANRCNVSASYYNIQWNLERMGHARACSALPQDAQPVIVAVLDTGVAYADDGTYRQASDLAGVPIVAPYDFIQEDAKPYDDHQHGTHIATTILGTGRVNGVAPGASLMPIKVLDAGNRGNELALARGIRHAVDNGARILNMSLSFPVSYVPSGVLQEAVSYAASRGVLMVASSGNAGASTLPYPAAFREVLSVGAVRLKKLSDGSLTEERASYANYGPGLDLVAPGGSLQHDANGDGWPDGILGQTIRNQNPASLSWYFYAGTSQAAAQVSGIAAWLLAAGATPDEARDTLLETARDLGDEGYDEQYGQGLVSLYDAVSHFMGQAPPPTPNLMANILTGIYGANDLRWGVARVRVVDGSGHPVSGARVLGQWSGSVEAKASGITDGSGFLTLNSPAVEEGLEGAIFALEVTTVIQPNTGRRVRPREFYYLSQGLSALLRGVLEDEATLEALLAFDLSPQDTSLEGVFDRSQLQHSFTIKAIGPSLGTPGVGIAFTPRFIPGLEDGTLPRQEVTLEFGQPLPYGNGTRAGGSVVVYSGGVGLALSHMGKSSNGVGLALSHMGRLAGGVGLALSHMGRMPVDSSLISGMAGGEPAELVRNEDPSSFLSANQHLDGEVALSLSLTRLAANSVDATVMEGILGAASAEEAEAALDEELGAGTAAVELGDEALSLSLVEE